MADEQEKTLNWQSSLPMFRENELWLNDQASKGMIIKYFALDYACFVEDHSQNRTYKFVVISEKNAERQIRNIEHQGFIFVESYKEYYLFYTNRKYAYTQPRLDAEMTEFARKWFNWQLVRKYVGKLAAMLLFGLNLLLVRDVFLQGLMEISSIFSLSLLSIYMVKIINYLTECRSLIKNKKYYLTGESYVSYQISKKSHLNSILTITFCVLLGISILKYFYTENTHYPINEVRKVMPVVMMQNIEKDYNFNKEILPLQKTAGEENYATIRHTLLAPKQYMATQGVQYHFMNIHYYKVTIGTLAKPLARELCMDSIFIKSEDIKCIEYDDFDAVYISDDSWQKKVSVCKGKQVLSITYYGDRAIADILSEISKVL
ncbi:DUF2812 domain-containing protein [Aminipila terrae]|uniref:DUF2812 domain-containing protein n=1 Tax=Aminipila terrae TaxID=2697030 RepID=A0A6P1M9C1_9FIRM|nr:DUF2812 domain-containing protein [Aminipila terrae]QHI71210.1 DUF2812 domain-containing protein [Aminipila terrae]